LPGAMASESVNRLVVSAVLAQVYALRYTPAGIPALDMVLEHQSEAVQMGQTRQVQLVLRATAFGAHAETLATQSLGIGFEFQGFLAHARNGKGVVFQIQDFTKI